jgi:hypothetical protein
VLRMTHSGRGSLVAIGIDLICTELALRTFWGIHGFEGQPPPRFRVLLPRAGLDYWYVFEGWRISPALFEGPEISGVASLGRPELNGSD